MFRPRVRYFWHASLHYNLRGFLEAFWSWGLGEGQKAQSARPGVARKKEPGRLAGRHYQDFLLGSAYEDQLSHTTFGEPLPQFSFGWKRRMLPGRVTEGWALGQQILCWVNDRDCPQSSR